jgi:hypothetical protein
VTLPRNRLLQGGESARMEDEFLEERRHVGHTTVSRQGPRQPRLKVKSSHRYRAGHRNGVGNRRRYPNCAIGRDNPCTMAAAYRHHSARGVDKLVSVMKMQRDHVPRGIVVGESGYVGMILSQAVEDHGLSLLQHLLSQ